MELIRVHPEILQEVIDRPIVVLGEANNIYCET